MFLYFVFAFSLFNLFEWLLKRLFSVAHFVNLAIKIALTRSNEKFSLFCVFTATANGEHIQLSSTKIWTRYRGQRTIFAKSRFVQCGVLLFWFVFSKGIENFDTTLRSYAMYVWNKIKLYEMTLWREKSTQSQQMLAFVLHGYRADAHHIHQSTSVYALKSTTQSQL